MRIGASDSRFTLFAVATVWVLVRIRKVAIPYWTAFRKRTAEFFGFLGEHLGGTEDIRANGAEAHVMGRFFGLVRCLWPERLRSGLAGYAMWMSNIALFSVGHAIAFGAGATLWRAGAITIGTVYLIFHYTELLRGPIMEIRTQITDLQRAEAGIRRIRQLLGTESALRDTGTTELPHGALGVEMRGVTFSYEPGALDRGIEGGCGPVAALADIDLEIAPGRVLGLLGRTGSGKTTLARLLVRLYDTQHGAVRVGGVPVCDVPLDALRRTVRLVPQEVQLFRATLRENVRLFDRRIPEAEVLAALEQLGLRSWALDLPEGLDTPLGADGGGLSAGEGQLVALARAFLADPGVVILDEASSRLDPATETLLEKAMDRLLAGRTGIIIAHRLATVERADDILILDGGRALEYGARNALAADPGSQLSRLLRAGLSEVLA